MNEYGIGFTIKKDKLLGMTIGRTRKEVKEFFDVLNGLIDGNFRFVYFHDACYNIIGIDVEACVEKDSSKPYLMFRHIIKSIINMDELSEIEESIEELRIEVEKHGIAKQSRLIDTVNRVVNESFKRISNESN
jgi:hypothetical protein